MPLYYLFSGWIANLGLIYYIVIVAGGMAAFGSTLTLPGIAGFILSVGMAVDANILIYERIREELAAGKSLKGALAAVTASVVGVIASLALWFGGHVLFRSYANGLPVWASLDWRAALLAALCAALLFRRGWGVLPVLARGRREWHDLQRP